MAANSVAYVAVYDNVDSALADLDAFEDLHDADLVGKYDAAVIDQENGKPHIVKRADHPAINALTELVGGGHSRAASFATRRVNSLRERQR